ncbi:MAG: phosphate ABC transporter permease subunit PstC [Verrucomicrobiota bacterium]|nr:phosphate ABC transporter permease subunit PstC [Verrucomicrobiota bacterium]
MSDPSTKPNDNPFRSRRWHLFGVDSDRVIRTFFAGNALVAIIILVLITIFLFKEGWGFFPQNYQNLKLYRQTGVEFVDVLKRHEEDFSALNRFLNNIRTQEVQRHKDAGETLAEANERLKPFDLYLTAFEEGGYDITDLVNELKTTATELRSRYEIYLNQAQLRSNLEKAGRTKEAAAIELVPVDLVDEVKSIQDNLPRVISTLGALAAHVNQMQQTIPREADTAMTARLEKFRSLLIQYEASFPALQQTLRSWDPQKPVSAYHAVTSFIFGREWVTNSYIQDWYGILPLFTGSLLVALIALCFAVPFGVAAAVYVNQIAASAEAKLIKPYIEFISALPSVVVGFFGVAVFGEFVRYSSQAEWLSWVPFFPISERLNAFTAGCLLALMAIPTIFTLAEDALNNVPRSFKEASLALGANRLQTTIRIIIPSALSGIISAILLGFGRVIGETMVVLLCAGNRISIPDFTQGVGIVFQPVHTMTGIIAQEMGEVVREGLHYRALFLVGIVLFFISLLVNFLAQKIVRRYKLGSN